MSWAPLPDEKYRIIYADPPWKYGGSGGRCWASSGEKYETISFERLKTLPVATVVDDERCLLFLWAVSPALTQCVEVGEAWGFKYVTVAFVWYKERANAGNYTMSGCELCLVLKRGKIPVDRVRNPGTKQFFSQRVEHHSKKPEEFRRRIEQMFPKSKKLELFACQKNVGWDSWGSEAKYGNALRTIAEMKKLLR